MLYSLFYTPSINCNKNLQCTVYKMEKKQQQQQHVEHVEH